MVEAGRYGTAGEDFFGADFFVDGIGVPWCCSVDGAVNLSPGTVGSQSKPIGCCAKNK
jgi:hypothetical protein